MSFSQPSPGRPSPGRHAPLVFGLVALVAASAIGGGWWWRERQETLHRAVLLTGGAPERGRGLIRHYGCAGCHSVPGVAGAKGQVGPSLQGFAGRVYLAGSLENTPGNLIRWIEDPRALDPRTAMPRTGAAGRDARDIAAYLYTLR
jgi:cytochrome c